jgi:hypothetical protein
VANGSTATRFAYDGLEMIAEYDGSNVLTRRYVYGPGTDEPIVQYDGAGTTGRAPPITPAERKAAQNGDRSAFWSSRLADGDPLAPTALSIVNNSDFSGQYANFRLRQAIFARRAWDRMLSRGKSSRSVLS